MKLIHFIYYSVGILVCIALVIRMYPHVIEAAFTSKVNLNRGLVGYWSFDEDAGTTVPDHSGSGNKGTAVNGPTGTTGQMGRALSFDGVNDYVDLGTPATFPTAPPLTISAWVKFNTVGAAANNRHLVCGNTNQWCFYHKQANNKMTLGKNGLDEVVSNTAISDTTTWHHVAVSYNGSNATFYLDGASDGSPAYTTSFSATQMTIGVTAGLTGYLPGSLDDVRIYNRALSASEITRLYHSAGKVTQKNPNKTGLVGWWTLDSNDINGTTAVDKSGNGNNGTLTGTTATTGKLAQARSFNGTSDYVTLPTAGLATAFNNLSFSFWFKTTATVGGTAEADLLVIGNRSTGFYGVLIDGSASGVELYTNYGNVSPAGIAQTSINNGQWHHIVGVWSGNTTMTTYLDGVNRGSSTGVPLSIGSNESAIGANKTSNRFYFNGSIDDVRIYNRALSATEIATLYANRPIATTVNASPISRLTSGLVGYWTFDGKDTAWSSATAGTVTDRSGNSNTGTMTLMNQATSPVIGKHGQALNFDGVNDYVNIGTTANFPNGSSARTVSFWTFLKNNSASDDYFMSWGHAVTGGAFFAPRINVFGNISLMVNNTGAYEDIDSSTSLSTIYNKWAHLAFTYDGSTTVKIYLNGAFLYSADTGAILNTLTGYDAYIGARNSSGYNNGINADIDDVRIYNRALSASEVSQLYNAGR